MDCCSSLDYYRISVGRTSIPDTLAHSWTGADTCIAGRADDGAEYASSTIASRTRSYRCSSVSFCSCTASVSCFGANTSNSTTGICASPGVACGCATITVGCGSGPITCSCARTCFSSGSGSGSCSSSRSSGASSHASCSASGFGCTGHTGSHSNASQ